MQKLKEFTLNGNDYEITRSMHKNGRKVLSLEHVEGDKRHLLVQRLDYENRATFEAVHRLLAAAVRHATK